MRRFIKKIVIFAVILAVVLGFWHYENNTIQTEVFSVASKRLPAAFDGFRLAVISDLHGRSFGEDNADLIAAVQAANPDLIALIGDIADERTDLSILTPLCEGLVDIAPCFYVTGNHEWRGGEAERICADMEARGVTLLRGDAVDLTAQNGQTIQVCGVDDPEAGMEGQLQQAGGQVEPGKFSLLLAHRPEGIEAYLEYPFDLVVSGHAHGGQWRIPGILNGLIAPNQGLFPEYAGGQYDLENATLIVSRGLARESTRVPRIFNRPEVVVIDLTPA